MSWRDYARDAADTAIGFARVTASALGAAGSLVLDIIIAEDDDETGETQEEAEVYGEAALLFRPADADDTGAPEVVVMRHGDERIVIATKDRRWQVELEKGDVCVRAMGADKPRLFLRADGTAVLEADTIKLGDAGATNTIALGDAIKAHLDDLKTWADAHTHGYLGDSGAPALTTPPTTTPAPPWTPLNPSPTVPDVESRHLVED